MNRIGYLLIVFGVYSQMVFPQDDMVEILRNKTLSEYVASCDHNEEQALLKLLRYEMPKKISRNYSWYTICDLDQDHCLAKHSTYESISYFGSLQLKAFSWIIRIYNGDYDEYPYRYDFGYDYVRSADDSNKYVRNNNTDRITAKLSRWTRYLNRYGLAEMREKGMLPISTYDYKLRLFHRYPTYAWKYDNTLREDTFDVLYYLKHRTLSEYVTNCDSDIVLAIQRLQKIDLPKVCSDSLMWYSEKEKLIYYDHKNVECPRKYVSLKQKAYSWIIRIYFDDYQECNDFYDFGYYDYEITKGKGCLKRVVKDKEIALDNYIKEWLENNDWYLFLHEREYAKAPIRIKDYSIIRNIKH